MRSLTVASFLLLLGGCRASDSPVKALVGGTLIDGTGRSVPDAVVVISGNSIQAAGPRADVAIPGDAAKMDVTGKFVAPGLVDVRVKVTADSDQELPLFAKAGVTTVGIPEGGATVTVTVPHVVRTGSRTAGLADSVIASNGPAPEDTFTKIERMGKAEIPAGDIVRAATKNGAEWLGAMDAGTIAAGHKADLLILGADPSRDAKNWRKVERVMVDGKWVK